MAGVNDYSLSKSRTARREGAEREPIAAPKTSSPGKSERLSALYAQLSRPDRDHAADRQKNPVLAGFLSLLVPGFGQIYNRQLFKAISWLVLSVIVGVVLLLIVLSTFWPFARELEGWRGRTGHTLGNATPALKTILGGLWIAGILDAVRTAWLLRKGKLIVRFSFKKQAMMIAAGMVPLAGALTPEETVALDDLDRSATGDLTHRLVKNFVMGKLRKVIAMGVVVLGLLPIVIGAIWTMPWLVIVGAIVVLGAMLVFLMG
jgi:TM2 domain-containing membrane protein YozV